LDSRQGRGGDFFSLRHRFQASSEAHPDYSYPIGSGGKAAGAWSLPLISL